ncbi:Gfo/Idh/MocA family protein [Pedobacter psychroterrae]|uniref:Gfo/Idh/MocA family oxidoreductase n=1 Tax=Pedobacter psychroterrae TaxID=2530453 RepID=A0A4R0NPN6_9SPHI|nr:Gfo/Idh/MocA family oxidoreductase [Pedobacter psychroterrae]TCD01185.1 Gfo/Idh/MocA family oxidoreductase [Pedobacter psychroterrae]
MKEKLTRRDFLGKAALVSTFFIVPRHVLGGIGYTAPSDMLSLGFIGCGKQAFGLKNAFLDTAEAQIVAACDVYGHKLDAFTNQVNKYYADKAGKADYKSCKSYDDFRHILERKDVDAVVIVTPDHWHAAMAVRAAEAGKDIYCEKPLSLTVAEGRAMVDATRKHKRVFQTGSMQRSSKEFRDTVELVRGGFIGDIKQIKVSVGGPPVPYDLQGQPVPTDLNWNRWLGPNEYSAYHNDLAPKLTDDFWGKWRSYKEFGGGMMTDWGAHMFDIAQWALDKDSSGPVEIIPPDGNEHKFLTYKYADGTPVTHEDFGIGNGVRFIGSEGQIDVVRGKMTTTPDSLKDKVPAAGTSKVYTSENHYKDFLNAMRQRSKPICDVETGHRTATMCTIGNIAYELKRPLKWDPVKEKFNDAQANALCSRKLNKEWGITLK